MVFRLPADATGSQQLEAPHRMAIDVVAINLKSTTIVLDGIKASSALTQSKKIAPSEMREAICRPTRLVPTAGAPQNDGLNLLDNGCECSLPLSDPYILKP